MQDLAKELVEFPPEPNESHGNRSNDNGILSWGVLVLGMLIWCCVQGYLILMPLYTRAMLPEPDDTLPYVLRTARLEECFSWNCPALADLREQLFAPSPNHEVAVYRAWAANAFGSQNPLFSLALLSLKRLGIDLVTAYKVVCVAAVILFCAGFAYFLAVLYGIPAAGIGMMFLALKVYPDTGLNFVVPSNLTMGVALFVIGRVIYCRGRAPWTLALGTLIMAGIHPIGLLYATIGAAVALSLTGYSVRQKAWLAALGVVVGVLVLGMMLPSKVYVLPKYLEVVSLTALLRQGIDSLTVVGTNLLNLKEGLFGAIPLFFGALAWGYVTLGVERRTIVKKTFAIYSIFVVLVMFYPVREPGDTFFRIAIPHVVILFGLCGHGLWYALNRLRSMGGRCGAESGRVRLEECWPVLIVALLAGWWSQMAFAGAEQVLLTAEHYRKRQPLQICDSQPELLLSLAKPDDRVLYLSMLIMPYYFINGCMKIGAVYYHDVMKETEEAQKWLSRPDLRFAAAYNPLVYHPSFRGLHERRWGISAPNFRFSQWHEPRVYGPVLEEDAIPLEKYKWIEIEPTVGPFPRRLRLTFNNPETECRFQLIPIGESDEPLTDLGITKIIPGRAVDRIKAEYEGASGRMGRVFGKTRKLTRIDVDLESFAGRARRLRLILTDWKPTARLAGVSFDDSPLHWPWDHRARLIFMHKEWEVGKLIFSFDPALILPDPVNRKEIKVLNDCGGSVLFQIGR